MPYRKTYRPRRKPYRKGKTRKYAPRRGSLPSTMLYRKANYRFYIPRRGITYAGLPKSAFQAEKKLVAMTKQNSKTTTAIQTGASASMVGFVLGSKPEQWTGNIHNLHGLTIPKGDDQDQRNGQYVFLSHSNIFFNLESATSSTTGNCPPCEFRVIVFRARRASNPAGIAYDPATTLFLDDLGNQYGHATTGIDGTDLTRRLLNRRDWIIKTDRRFVLSRPMITDSDGGQVSYSGKYPVMKNYRFKLPFYKKTRYDASNLPQDTAYHWGVFVYCRALAKESGTAGDWECNIRGNTVFLDP